MDDKQAAVVEWLTYRSTARRMQAEQIRTTYAAWEREREADAEVMANSGIIEWQPEPQRRRIYTGPRALGYYEDRRGTGAGSSTAKPGQLRLTFAKSKGRKGKLPLENKTGPTEPNPTGEGEAKGKGVEP